MCFIFCITKSQSEKREQAKYSAKKYFRYLTQVGEVGILVIEVLVCHCFFVFIFVAFCLTDFLMEFLNIGHALDCPI